MNARYLCYLPLLLLLTTCGNPAPAEAPPAEPEVTATEPGVRLIPITTPAGEFNVYTRRVGQNPDVKVLFLHGGPGASSEYYEIADAYFPQANIEYYYYDQLGSARSDQPDDPSLWTIDRFVDEVEQVRQALDLDAENFYIIGHSWGGILGVEYALKHPDKLNGLVISNMMMDIEAYNRYADDVLGPALPADTLAKIRKYEDAGDYQNADYLNTIYGNYYPRHVLRGPMEGWPEPVMRAFGGLNNDIYLQIQGPSEFGIRGDASLVGWSRMEDLDELEIPVLVVSGKDDTMDPAHAAEVAELLPNGSHLATGGTHFAMWDDRDTYWPGILRWIEATEEAGMSR